MKPLDNEVRAILGDLCRAINDSLKGSDRVHQSVQKLQGLGYEFALLVEATALLTAPKIRRKRKRKKRELSLSLSEEDKRYLQNLKITLDGREKSRD